MRYEWIEFLYKNKERFFEIENMPRGGERIAWQDKKDCKVLKLMKSDNARLIFENMELSSYSVDQELKKHCMMDKYYSGIEKQINELKPLYNKKIPTKGDFELSHGEYVEPIECLFLYFYISEAKPKLRGKELFDEIFSEAGLNTGLDSLAYVHDAVTLYILNQGLGLEEWIDKQYMWIDKDISPILELKRFPAGGRLNYKEWYAGVISPGLEEYENVQKTKRSLDIITNEIQNWTDITPKEVTMKRIANAEVRRRWYFCNLIYKIIEYQNAIGEFPLYSWTSDGNINVSAITLAFNDYFDGRFCEWTQLPSAMARIETRRAIEIKTEKEEGNDDARHCRPTFNELIKNCDSEKKPKKVGRELLLMTILMAKVYGVEISKVEYVQQRVLFNCRFGTKFYETRFDKYFLETFDALGKAEDMSERVEILQDFSAAFEESYLKENVAIFNRYLLGKK